MKIQQFVITCFIISTSLLSLASEFESSDVSALNAPQVLGQDDDNIFVFVQLTDLHISKFHDTQRYRQLLEFCRWNLPAIGPQVVLASGDLTDAVSADRLDTDQHEEEWVRYNEFYKECIKNSNVSHWLDLRGNHDNFNVDGHDSPSNYYPRYGAQGHRRAGSYMQLVDVFTHTKYAFIALDATVPRGLKGIFSFFGALDQTKLNEIEEYSARAESAKVNATFWFGHYPSSTIQSPSALHSLATKSMAYLCGHLHDLGGRVPQMYAYHSSGMLELQLTDWKKNRRYRIAAMDNGLFSFNDVKHGTWPAIVALNPKPAFTVQPTKEPYELVRRSSHIRLLIFSLSNITQCKLRINDENWIECRRTGTQRPLFTAPWDPSKYSNGLHRLEVKAKDSTGSEESVNIEFAVDGTRPDLASSFIANYVLTFDGIKFGKVLFVQTMALSIFPLLFLRYCYHNQPLAMAKNSENRPRPLCGGFWIVSNANCFFYPLLFYNVYMLFGPWFVAGLLQDQMALVFLWGTVFTCGEFIQTPTPFFLGFVHLVIFNIPLMVITASLTSTRERTVRRRQYDCQTVHRREIFVLYYLIPCFVSLHVAITITLLYKAYGWSAVIVNPLYLSGLLMALYFRHRALHLTVKDFQKLVKCWLDNDTPKSI